MNDLVLAGAFAILGAWLGVEYWKYVNKTAPIDIRTLNPQDFNSPGDIPVPGGDNQISVPPGQATIPQN